MPIQITVSNQIESKKIYVRFWFSTLNSWSYNYAMPASISFGNDHESPLTFHLIGTKASLFNRFHGYTIPIRNATLDEQDYVIKVQWYIEKLEPEEVKYESFDNEEFYDLIEEIDYDGSIESFNSEVYNENIHFI